MKRSRRQFLRYGISFGASVGIGIGLIRSRAAASQSKSSQTITFTYKGRQVEIVETDQTANVRINGRHQHHIKKLSRGRYASHMFPFKNYQDIVALVKGLIDAEDSTLFVL